MTSNSTLETPYLPTADASSGPRGTRNLSEKKKHSDQQRKRKEGSKKEKLKDDNFCSERVRTKQTRTNDAVTALV